jgi:hypothetical protein
MAAYLIKNKATGALRLIETRTKAGAINHVSQSDYEATALNTSELIKHIKSGLEVETLTKEDEEKTAELPGTEKSADKPAVSSGTQPANAKQIVKEGFAPKAVAAN